jgi:hypothetical protein
VGRIDVGVAVEARYERDAATGVRGEWGAVGVGRAGCCGVAPLHARVACVRGCAVRFKSPFARGGATAAAVKASGYLFNVRRDATTGKWYAQIKLRGLNVCTRYHKHAWQAAADLEWQLARWCAHTGQPRSHYVSNAARLVELGRADAAGVLTEALTVAPWDLSRLDGGGGKAVPAGERLCWAACGAAVARHVWLHVAPPSRPPTAQRTQRLPPRPTPAATARRRRKRVTATATASPSPSPRRRRWRAVVAVAVHPAPPQRLPALRRRHRRQPGQPQRERAPAAARPHHHHPPPLQQPRPPRLAAAA